MFDAVKLCSTGGGFVFKYSSLLLRSERKSNTLSSSMSVYSISTTRSDDTT